MLKKKKKIILIVEDEQPLLDVLAEKFTKEGFDVRKGRDGVEGLESARKEKPDVILLDIIMPVMDGMTMLTHLREDVSLKDIPVVILTNLTDQHKVAESLKQGVYDYLIKADWKLEDLIVKVRERLGS